MKKKYTCILDTVYSLFLYMLVMDLEQIERTRYYFGSAIPKQIDQFFLHVMRFDCNKICRMSKNSRRWFRIKMWLFYLCRIAGSEIYAQDHLCYSQQLICGAKYILLEDAPGIYSSIIKGVLYRPQEMTWFSRIANWTSRGRIGSNIFGTNNQCDERIVTEENDLGAKILKERKSRLVKIDTSWKKADENKKRFILRVFGVSEEMLLQFRGMGTILLTQPFCADLGMTRDELAGVYRPYVEKYKNDIVIKVHPRDEVDYKMYFPTTKILKSSAPMQLLTLVGVVFKRVITISSSSLSAFPSGVEIINVCPDSHPKIAEFMRKIGKKAVERSVSEKE